MEKYRLGNMEDVLSETDLSEVYDDVAETYGDTQLVVSGWYVYVESLDISLREGTVCIWDEEAKLFMPDFSVTVIYEGRESDEWLYYEQDDFVITLANRLNGRMSLESIEQLWCELVIPENTDK